MYYLQRANVLILANFGAFVHSTVRFKSAAGCAAWRTQVCSFLGMKQKYCADCVYSSNHGGIYGAAQRGEID